MTTTTPSSTKILPPGPRGHWLLGSVPEVRGRFIPYLQEMHGQYGDVFRLRVGMRPLYIVSHPDLAQEMLIERKREFIKPYDPKKPIGLQLVLGTGLLTNHDHDSWLSQRRMMQPMFHRKRIQGMVDKMIAAGEDMLTRWANTYQPGDVMDLEHEMMMVTLDIVNRTMFSTTAEADVGMVGNAVTVALKAATRLTSSPIRISPNIPTPNNIQFRRALAQMDTFIYGLIDQRRQAGVQYGDLLDMLLDARDEETGEGMSDKQIRDEVLTIFGAGHETTANALTWGWYALAQHPHILAKLQEEVDTVLGDRVPTTADLRSLPYTKAVFDEVLRMYPPAPVVPRRVLTDTEIAGYHIPAGTILLICVNNLHYHPDFWDAPQTFAPAREHPAHHYAYMPFGGGPRICIGSNFAQVEGQLLLAMTAQRYDLSLLPAHPVEKAFAVTMRPKYGMKMIVTPR